MGQPSALLAFMMVISSRRLSYLCSNREYSFTRFWYRERSSSSSFFTRRFSLTEFWANSSAKQAQEASRFPPNGLPSHALTPLSDRSVVKRLPTTALTQMPPSSLTHCRASCLRRGGQRGPCSGRWGEQQQHACQLPGLRHPALSFDTCPSNCWPRSGGNPACFQSFFSIPDRSGSWSAGRLKET